MANSSKSDKNTKFQTLNLEFGELSKKVFTLANSWRNVEEHFPHRYRSFRKDWQVRRQHHRDKLKESKEKFSGLVDKCFGLIQAEFGPFYAEGKEGRKFGPFYEVLSPTQLGAIIALLQTVKKVSACILKLEKKIDPESALRFQSLNQAINDAYEEINKAINPLRPSYLNVKQSTAARDKKKRLTLEEQKESLNREIYAELAGGTPIDIVIGALATAVEIYRMVFSV